MAADNSVTIIGNITDDPELRFTNGGQAMAKMTVANNRRWQDKASGEWREEVSFFNVTLWRELAENASQSLKKGMRVMVTGRLQQRSWQTPEGDKRSVVEVQADEVGPSLRWASAEITRNPRKEEGAPRGGGGGGGGGYDRPSGNAPAPIEDQPWSEEPAF